MKIKICGITCKKEIEYINELKPDYIGFVFTKSKRQINPYKAEELRKLLSAEIKSVGVFKDNSIDEIISILKIAKLDIIQLHGNEDINFIKQLKSKIYSNIEIWKALSIKNKAFFKEYISYYQNEKYKYILNNLLIDGLNPGSGETYSLSNLKELLTDKSLMLNRNLKFILAGGITSSNVLDRIHEINPWGIDVSSGVEEFNDNQIRKKSYSKMECLINKVKKL